MVRVRGAPESFWKPAHIPDRQKLMKGKVGCLHCALAWDPPRSAPHPPSGPWEQPWVSSAQRVPLPSTGASLQGPGVCVSRRTRPGTEGTVGSDGCKDIRQKSLPPPPLPFRRSRPFPWLGSSHHPATAMVDGPRGPSCHTHPLTSASTQQANRAQAGPRASSSTSETAGKAPRAENIPSPPAAGAACSGKIPKEAPGVDRAFLPPPP